jgi:multiple sugar transport system permease protein
MIQHKLFRTVPIIPILLLVLLIGMAPFLTALFDSFFHDYYGDRSFAGLENFRYILKDRAFPYSLNITVLWALINVLLSLTFGFLLALRLISTNKTTNTLYKTLLIPWGIPVYIAIPLWRALLHGNGGESVITKLTGIQINLMIDPLSGFLGAAAVSLWLSIPLSAFVFAGHMRKVSKQVLEAAKLDGAGEGEIALYIYIPEIRESILAMGVLNFIKAFKEFTLVFMMTAGGPPMISGITERHIIGATTTLGVFLYEIFLQTGDWGINAAYSIVMGFLIIFIMSLWILIKKESSVKPFLFLSALAQIPGAVPVLWVFSGGYLLSVIRPGLTVWLFSIQSIYIIFRIWKMGFLAGFHPGILIPLLAVIIIFIKKRQNKILRHDPVYKWKGLGFRKFLSPKVMTISSGLLAILYTTVTGIILYMLLWMSFSKTSVSYVDSFLPSMASLDNYRIIFQEENILKYFINTLIVAGLTALLLPVLIFPGAVWLNKLGRTKTLTLLGFLQILGIAGGMHSLIPLYRIFMNLGLINSYIPLILIYLYHSIPFSLFILTAYLETIPSVFKDLAKIEGMSSISYTFRILLPLSMAPLLSSVMVAFISGWNGFQAALLFLNDERMYTISLKLYSYVGNLGSGSPVWNLFAAAAVVNTLFIGLLFIRFKNPMEKSPLSESTY